MDQIRCPHCSKSFEISKVIRDELEKHLRSHLENEFQQKSEEEKKLIEQKTAEKYKKEFEFSVKIANEEIEEEKKRNSEFQKQILELTQLIRKARQEKDDLKTDLEKKLFEKEEKIKEEARKKATDEFFLKIQEKEKQLEEALRKNEELRQKLQQGSQQTQGEVFELELEKLLIKEFPNDQIKPVPKGIRGADLIQVVIDKYGRNCGTILWESKNAHWSEGWIAKLKDDQRVAKANIAVLVTMDLPKECPNFSFRSGVWVSNRDCMIGLAHALRINLAQLFISKLTQVGKNEKMENLYSYLTGLEFRHRVEAIIEAFTNLQSELEKEKRWFALKWAKEEKDLRKIIDSTHNMYGELQSIVGTQSLPHVVELELEDGVSPLDVKES